jgi:hypothetical protein
VHDQGTDPEEIERLARVARGAEELGQVVYEVRRLLNAFEFYSPTVREELEREPERALRILREADEKRAELTSPAGYAIARFRAGYDPAALAPHERPPEPLSDEELEAALSYSRSLGFAPAIAAAEEELARRRAAT